MTVLLHLSDLHFGTECEHAMEAVVRLCDEQRPQLVITSGDITQRARPRQFDRAREFLDRLAAPTRLVIPGNHDIPLFNLYRRWQAPFAGWHRVFGPDLEPTYDAPGIWVTGVNTTRASRHKDGEVSGSQIRRVADALRASPPRSLRIVVTHHPLAVTTERDRTNVLHGAGAALREWSSAGADLLLGGHIHLPYSIALHEAGPGLGRRMWILQAGTAISRRIRPEAGHSLNIVRHHEATGWSLERWDLGDDGTFVRRHSLVIAPDRGDDKGRRTVPTPTPSACPTPRAWGSRHTAVVDVGTRTLDDSMNRAARQGRY